MPSDKRRARSDSASAAVEAFSQAGLAIGWPPEIGQLQDEDQARRCASAFTKIIATRAPQDWTDAAVLIAARWAKAMVLSDSLTSQLEMEGWVIPSANNPLAMVRNPLSDALSQSNQICLALSRMLQLSGGADRRTLGNNRRAIEETRRLEAGADAAHGLLA